MTSSRDLINTLWSLSEEVAVALKFLEVAVSMTIVTVTKGAEGTAEEGTERTNRSSTGAGKVRASTLIWAFMWLFFPVRIMLSCFLTQLTRSSAENPARGEASC